MVIDPNDPISAVQQIAQQNNMWSAEQAQNQMDFQERMANTAHQREIADLKASGLNPVLSARLGGAETPSGAMGTTDTSNTQALIEALKEFGEGMINSAAGAVAAGSGRGRQFSDGNSALLNSLSLDTKEYVKGKSSQEMLKDAANAVRSDLPGVISQVSSLISTKNPKTILQKVGNSVASFLTTNSAKLANAAASNLEKNGPSNPASGYYYMKNYEGGTKATSSDFKLPSWISIGRNFK